MTPAGIEPATFRFVAQHLNHCAHTSPGIGQIPAELIKAGGRTICCAIHKLSISIWNKEELPEEWKE